MSKYTTEVRFICESKSGLTESKGCDKVDEVLENSWNKIFTTNCAFFDETLLFKGDWIGNCWYMETVDEYEA